MNINGKNVGVPGLVLVAVPQARVVVAETTLGGYHAATQQWGPLVSPSLAASLSGYHRQHIYRLMSEGRLQVVVVMGWQFVRVEELQAYIEERRKACAVGPGPSPSQSVLPLAARA